MSRRAPKARPSGRTRVIAYTRVSTDQQAEEGVSLAAQAERLRAYAVATDLELVAEIEDAGLTGANLDRPGLRRALDLLGQRRADALLVCKLDRLTRSVRDLGHLVDEHFAEGGASLISLGESIDTRSASGRLVLHVLGAVSAWEREACAERTSQAMRHMRRQGRYTGGIAPYGHALSPDGVLVPDPGEQEVIRRARSLRDEGVSLRAIATTLANEGHLSRAGHAFEASAVRRMLLGAEPRAGRAA